MIGAEAMALGAERAKRNGVCVVGLAHSHHLGRIGHWAEQCIGHGLVSIHFVNVLSRPIVAPFGGRDARLGTNPFCVGIPRPGGDPIVLDFATSKIAQGKTRVAYNKGVPVEPGTIIDNHGEPTTDPRFTVIEPLGRLLPFGEHKGVGPGADLRAARRRARRAARPAARSDGRRSVLNSMFSILVDPAKIGTAENLAREMESFVAWHIASPPAEGVDRREDAGRAGARDARSAAGRGHPGRRRHLAGDRRGRREGRPGQRGHREAGELEPRANAVVARLDRAIQYAVASRFDCRQLWNTGSPARAG